MPWLRPRKPVERFWGLFGRCWTAIQGLRLNYYQNQASPDHSGLAPEYGIEGVPDACQGGGIANRVGCQG